MEVYLEVPAWLSLLAVASLFLYWYLTLIRRLALSPTSPVTGMVIVGAAILSFCAAEVVVFFVFGGQPTLFEQPSPFDMRANIHNWIVLTIHVSVSLYLYRRARAATTIVPNAPNP
jgi:hypothetical protein